MGFLFLLFVLVPFAELYILIRIGRVIGAWYTLLGVIAVGLCGAYLAKQQGLRVFRQWQAALNEGRLPEEGILGGILVLLGSVLLITPGVLTDVVGLALLLPWTRRALAPIVRRAVERRMQEGTIRVQTISGSPFGPVPGRPRGHSPDGVIDTEGEDVTPESRGSRKLDA
jgi:UPF0716 protein FxsA